MTESSSPVSPDSLSATRNIKSQWSDGAAPDAVAALAEHPSLQEDKAAVLDLAYEEFFRRRLNGEDLDPEVFSKRFPQFQASVHRTLLADQMLGGNPSMVENAPMPDHYNWPEPGQKIGTDITLLRELGRGCFARVYLAIEASTGDRPVALKLARQACSEARTLGRLSHDHIVPILWARQDEASGLHMVCMPFLGTATLLDVLDRAYYRGKKSLSGAVIAEAIEKTLRPSDPRPDRPRAEHDFAQLSFVEAILRLAVGISDALAFVHGRKLVHCDLKPSNILLTWDGVPLLLDFNLSLTEAPAARIGGTLHYMAPEHIGAWVAGKPMPAEVGGQSDLFALGVILYELLTGSHPLGSIPRDLKGGELAGWLLDRQKQGFCPVRELNPDIPEEVGKLLDRCLCLELAGRPASAAAFAAELRRLCGPKVAPPQPATSRPARFLLGISVLLAIALTSVLALAVWTALGKLTPEDGQTLLNQAQASLKLAEEAHRGGRKTQAEKGARAAIVSLKQAIEATDEPPPTAYATRGRAWMILGDWEKAADDLGRASKDLLKNRALKLNEEQARTLACLSCCATLRREHSLAWFVGERVLNDFPSPGMYNNVAYSYLMGSHYKEAGNCLEKAMKAMPGKPPLLQIRYNRCVLALDEHLLPREKRKNEEPVPIPSWAPKEFAEVLQQFKQQRLASSRPYEQAARLCACVHEASQSKEEKEEMRKRIEEYLDLACALGLDPSRFPGDPHFRKALPAEWLASKARQPTSTWNPTLPFLAYLVDPLTLP